MLIMLKLILSLLLSIMILPSCSMYELDEENIISNQLTRKTKIIAHRGYWKAEGACDNSIKALVSAIDIGVDGVEFDLRMTKDDSVVVYHDGIINGSIITQTYYKDLLSETLPNGEKIPTLRDYLRIAKSIPSVELFIEIKVDRAVEPTIKILKEEGVNNPIMFISFSEKACEQIIAIDSSLRVSPLQPLSQDVTSSKIKDLGYTGIAYTTSYYHNNTEVIDKALYNGMTLTTWVANTIKEYDWFYRHGFNYVISDDPLRLINQTKRSESYWYY